MGFFCGPAPSNPGNAHHSSLPDRCPSCLRRVTYDVECRPRRCWVCGPLILDVENWRLIALKDQVFRTEPVTLGHGFREASVNMKVPAPYKYAFTGYGVAYFPIGAIGFFVAVFNIVCWPNKATYVFSSLQFLMFLLGLWKGGWFVKVPRRV